MFVAGATTTSLLLLQPAQRPQPQIIWLGSKRQVEKVNILHDWITATSVRTVDSARDLGVFFDLGVVRCRHSPDDDDACEWRVSCGLLPTLPVASVKTFAVV